MSGTESAGFENIQVVAFENRKSREMAMLISRQGGAPIIAPAMREIPLEENPEAFVFAGELLANRLDAVVFMTGVGTRLLSRYSAPSTRFRTSDPPWAMY